MAPRLSAHLGRSELPIEISDSSSRASGVLLVTESDMSLYFLIRFEPPTSVIKSDRWEQCGDF